ncbi:hypothetical protein IMZ48_37305 [Candidatus Bathyarchaeota archaeon]|nr:hypothetical protein [Candidatus Bathyarchaeota archaeon]
MCHSDINDATRESHLPETLPNNYQIRLIPYTTTRKFRNPPAITFTSTENRAQHPRRQTMASQQRNPQTRPAPATQTQTQTVTPPEQAGAPPAPILRLRGAHTSRRRVQWTEDVVDNEKLNRKKSKGSRYPLPFRTPLPVAPLPIAPQDYEWW